MYYRDYGADEVSSTPDTVAKDYDDDKITWTQAQAVCVAAGKEFEPEDGCVAAGSPGTESAMETVVKADSRATWIAFGGIAVLAWILLR